MITTISADGTDVRALDSGQGPIILVVHPGMDDGSSWKKVTAVLAGQFRVLTLLRRQYRLDIASGVPASIAEEVADIKALARLVGKPMLIVGHSSGAVVALEALSALPTSFTGGVLYEPPLRTDGPVGGVALLSAKAAIAAGKPGKAMQIFTRDMVGLPAWQAAMIRVFVAASPRLRRLVPRQMDDNTALEELGTRLDLYKEIQTPVLLIGGDKSPGHLGRKLDVLARTVPNAGRHVMRGQGHSANLRAPDELARVIAEFHAAATRQDPGIGRP
ncbi:MAG TPA: alpha/beta hydrolase [Arthrobacter sp.]|nr:alpha/beta hydrolase [Arthrobacter sp.]